MGLAVEGTPPAPFNFAEGLLDVGFEVDLVGVDFDFPLLLDPFDFDGFPFEDAFELPEPRLAGELLGDVEVEVEGEGWVLVRVVPVLVGVVLGEVGVVPVEVDAVDVHDSVIDATGPVTGREIEDSGVPGGT